MADVIIKNCPRGTLRAKTLAVIKKTAAIQKKVDIANANRISADMRKETKEPHQRERTLLECAKEAVSNDQYAQYVSK